MSPAVRSIHSQLALEARATRHRVYMDARWRGPGGTRDRTLLRANGRCEYEGCQRLATIADHYPVPLASILHGGGNPYDDVGCRALCAHHSGIADGGRS